MFMYLHKNQFTEKDHFQIYTTSHIVIVEREAKNSVYFPEALDREPWEDLQWKKQHTRESCDANLIYLTFSSQTIKSITMFR